MKKLFLILIAGLTLVMAQDFKRAYAGDDGGDDGGIPLSKLAGKYSETFRGGTITTCFKPDFSATENCFTKGAVPLSSSFGASVGEKTQDKDGNSCTKATGSFGLPAPLAAFPNVVVVFFSATKVTNYDPATGSGDESFTNYTGGKCIGSKFDSTGAIISQTGTSHFVASDNGKRVDLVVTTFTDPLGDIGAFDLPGFDLKQK